MAMIEWEASGIGFKCGTAAEVFTAMAVSGLTTEQVGFDIGYPTPGSVAITFLGGNKA